jgi:hypothetical protein
MRHVSLDIWQFSMKTGQWSKLGTVAYESELIAPIPDGEWCTFVAVDPAAQSCRTKLPSEGDCIYASYLSSLLGDSTGSSSQWQIP